MAEAPELEALLEEGDIQSGNPLPIGGRINKETESVSFCSADTRPAFVWSSTSILMILLRKESSTSIRCVIARVTFGTFGCEALP